MVSGISVTEANVVTVLRSFLLNIMPAGIEVIRSQVNRVPPPKNSFIMMTPLNRKRLAINEETGVDVAFIGSIAGTQLTISEILAGEIVLGAVISGSGVT